MGVILEVFPSHDGTPTTRRSTAPRDLASTVLRFLYAATSVTELLLALAAAITAGVFQARSHTCLPGPDSRLCRFTFIAAGLTLPLAVGVTLLELLPSRYVSPGVRNLVPLLLLVVGMALWGVEAATLHQHDAVRHGPDSAWRHVLERIAWAIFAVFLSTGLLKLLSPVLEVAIDSASLRLCPGCMPACDACCCLDVRSAKVPREVLRHGQVRMRFLSWNQELVSTAKPVVLPPVLEP